MSLIDIVLTRRPRRSADYRPTFEVLEERQCMSVASPTGLTATALTPTQVKLNWNNIAGEQGYRVFRWDGTQATLVTSVVRDVTTFTDKTLQANRSYYYVVEAFDINTTARSAWVSVTTPVNPITAPTNVRLTSITQTSMTIQWNSGNGATGYKVYGWDGFSAFLVGTATPSQPALRIDGLSPGTTYFYFVQAVNATNSANSGWVSASTTAVGIATPTNFKATPVSASTIGLSWNNVASATGYKIYFWNGTANTTASLIATLGANTTGYQATGLLPGTNYWFYVQAFNSTAIANTAWVKTTTIAAAPLQAPTPVSVTAGGPNTAVVTWTEPARAVGCTVYRWTGYGWVTAANIARGTHSARIDGLATGFTHWFIVQAYTDNFAETAASSAVYVNL